ALAHLRRRRLDGGDEGPLDLGTGGVAAGVQDSGRRMPALARQREGGRLAVAGLVEHRTHGDELAHAVGAFGDEHPHGVGVTEPGAGGDGVGAVQLGGAGGRGGGGRGGPRARRASAAPPRPGASRVPEGASSPLVTTRTAPPAREACTAPDKPAIPLPSTSRSNISPDY